MTKEQYKKLLKHPKWNVKRKEILKRDKLVCRRCGRKNCMLHVHHKYYIEGKLPWEYPNSCFLTLCKKCHTKEHKGKKIGTYIRKAKKKKK